MDDSTLPRNTDDIDENKQLFNELGSQKDIILTNLMKHSLLFAADRLLMARKPEPFNVNEANTSNNGKIKGKYASKQTKKASMRYKTHAIQSNSSHFDTAISYNEFPLNFIVFFTVQVIKLACFQISLFLRLFTFPIWLLNFSLMFLMFPYQTLTRIRDQMKKKLMRACYASSFKLISIISNKIKSKKSVLKLATRFGRAFFCSFYVFFVLLGLLLSAFAISGIVIRNLVEESIQTTETLSFDYTKTSPVAVVPVASSLVNGEHSQYEISASEKLGRHAIPYNHKLQLTVSLTLPESEYNRKLGVFQVRVESLSANGKLITGSSYPTMLRFKSQPIRVIETLFKSVQLITGLKSEVQNLKIKVGEFTEGYEPTASFRVVLEQRAEFQGGSGAPEIYGASLEISSELPQLKRVVWNWRRTIFVWISFALFTAEMMVFLVVCRPVVIIRRGRSKANNKSLPAAW
ncbi:hypothetical protein BUALT_Bualt18G0040500 [Buddleja alternifolia]|uniref:Seipin n=1 Tax=Buddleja alternifolia TaxID=168488 RepID=A0AAV6W1U1_9LAMI|nr:hypothetical protein BUALT_Bualt18G0040500 [Buddleja alternifolia]